MAGVKNLRAQGTDKAPTAKGRTMAGVVKMGGGRAGHGSSSKKSLDKGAPYPTQLTQLHKAGKTVPTWNAERLAGLPQADNKTR